MTEVDDRLRAELEVAALELATAACAYLAARTAVSQHRPSALWTGLRAVKALSAFTLAARQDLDAIDAGGDWRGGSHGIRQ